jgi:DNA-binding transcriptional ArsR family regulator
VKTPPFAPLGDGALVSALAAERSISQPAVSQHLRVLRDAHLVSIRSDGTRRLYASEHRQPSTTQLPGSRDSSPVQIVGRKPRADKPHGTSVAPDRLDQPILGHARATLDVELTCSSG